MPPLTWLYIWQQDRGSHSLHILRSLSGVDRMLNVQLASATTSVRRNWGSKCKSNTHITDLSLSFCLCLRAPRVQPAVCSRGLSPESGCVRLCLSCLSSHAQCVQMSRGQTLRVWCEHVGSFSICKQLCVC